MDDGTVKWKVETHRADTAIAPSMIRLGKLEELDPASF